MNILYLAICSDCTPTIRAVFSDSSQRDEWAIEHADTGHRIANTVEVRLSA